MPECRSFAPVISDKSKILILGSMPGEKSLKMSQYYAHPQNRFWKVMSVLCNNADMVMADYSTKLEILKSSGFALWDVIKYCKREGSLDTAINNEKPNNVIELLKKYPNINKIAFNGNKAFNYFKKSNANFNYEYIILPSTSPANANYQFPRLIACWQKLL